MQVALYARVSTKSQQQAETITTQVQLLRQHVQQQGWTLCPTHEFLDDGISGTQLARPALDRLRDVAAQGAFEAVLMLSPDRLARSYAQQLFLLEELRKRSITPIFLHNPYGDTPAGKLLTHMQGVIAEYERTQILERTRRGRLEKARRGEFLPWAFNCYGYRYVPRQHGRPAQVLIDETQAAVVREIYRLLVGEQKSVRQITRHLNEQKIVTPSGRNQVWQSSVVSEILRHRVYIGEARYNYGQQELQTDGRKGSRQIRPESEWVLTESPVIIDAELFSQAQLQLQRNAATAQRAYRPASRRYLLRTRLQCGSCGLALTCHCQRAKRGEYLYYSCRGRDPLTTGRATKCTARAIPAAQLDELVWRAVQELLDDSSVLPQLHQTWAQAQQQDLSALTAREKQLREQLTRLERQAQRLLDAYQNAALSLEELQTRQRKLTQERQKAETAAQQTADSRAQATHWQSVIEHATEFRRLLGANLDKLSFEERQSVVQCLIQRVIITGEEVNIHFALPFETAPQVLPAPTAESTGPSGHFYRLRLEPHEEDTKTGKKEK